MKKIYPVFIGSSYFTPSANSMALIKVETIKGSKKQHA
jgi:hypothetical protein